MELLTYWIASSLCLVGTHKLPKVGSFTERWAIYHSFDIVKVLEPVTYGTVELGRPSNALGCNVKSDVAWGQTNGGQTVFLILCASSLTPESVEAKLFREVESIEECDAQSQWSDEGSMTSEFEPHDTDRHEIVQGWVMDQASDGHQEGAYPTPMVKRSFQFVEPTLDEDCGDWLI